MVRNPQTLAPLSEYQQTRPPSPYETAHEHRTHPEVAPSSYTYSQSGYNTSGYDFCQYPIDTAYSRHGSVGQPTQLLNEAKQTDAYQTLNPNTDSQIYPQSSHPDTAGSPRDIAQESHENDQYHGLPRSSHLDPIQTHPVRPHGDYRELPTGYGPIYEQRSSYPSRFRGDCQNQLSRRTMRAFQACDTCRTRKAKCDERKPKCGGCITTDAKCQYKDMPLPKADRARQEVLDQMKEIKELATNTQNEFNAKFNTIQRNQLKNEAFQRKIAVLMEQLVNSGLQSIQPMTQTKVQTFERQPRALSCSSGRLFNTTDPVAHDDAIVDNSGKEFAIGASIDHATGAHKLLRWPMIKALLRNTEPNEDFVMQMEGKKAMIRLWGKGSTRDTWDSGLSPASSCSSEDYLGGDFRGFFLVRPRTEMKPRDDDHPGGLTAEGGLKLDRPTMTRLLESFFDHIHLLHPFLDKLSLNRMCDQLHANLCYNPSQSLEYYSTNGPTARTEPTTGLKRKHSSESVYSLAVGANNQGLTYTGSEQVFEHRISAAIVLIVMALGKICEHNGPLPGPVPRSHPYNPRKGSKQQSSLRSDSAALSSSTGSPMSEQQDLSDASASHVLGHHNVDFVPGLAYFAKASEILGICSGGNELLHVQACLLAGLYTSQLALVIQSYKWILMASQSCLFLIREAVLSRTESRDLARADSIKFAYWTCLQLEGDIRAELDLRPSGIENPAKQPMFPQGIIEDPGDIYDKNLALLYYSSQIVLRTTLNKIQTLLYPLKSSNVPPVSMIPMTDIMNAEQALCEWRAMLPPLMQWEDEQPPSSNILEARLRAKYYGTLYIIHRPYLYHALHNMGDGQPTMQANLGQEVVEQTTPPSTFSTKSPPTTTDIMRSVELCVRAARWSTLAFDNVINDGHRLIVTNIFGTAHAQFGNMLVLAATYKSHLRSYVDREDLIQLLDRTINFLNSHAPISPTLAEDARILQDAREAIMAEDDRRMPVSSLSFTPNGSSP